MTTAALLTIDGDDIFASMAAVVVPLTPLQRLQARRDAYAAAELKILQGQSYSIGDGVNARTLTRADLPAVQAGIRELDVQIAAAQAVATPTRRVFYLR